MTLIDVSKFWNTLEISNFCDFGYWGGGGGGGVETTPERPFLKTYDWDKLQKRNKGV